MISFPKRPHDICTHCKRQCSINKIIATKTNWPDVFLQCVPCNTIYEETLWNQTIHMYCKINNKTYGLKLFINLNSSRIDYMSDDPNDTAAIICSFNYLLDNVTPDNIEHKVATYITFS